MNTQFASSTSSHVTSVDHSHENATEQGGAVCLVEASVLTKNYRKDIRSNDRKGGFFARNIFEKLLGQEGCVGVRMYFAATDSGLTTLVLIGLNAMSVEIQDGILGDDIIPCPPLCPAPNALNTSIPSGLRVRSSRDQLLTGRENHGVTRAEAVRLTGNYRRGTGSGDPDAVDFQAEDLRMILAEERNVGIRAYFAKNDSGKPTLVLVGADARGDDLVDGVIVRGRMLTEGESGSPSAFNS